ncbi:uncharacterized protein LOC144648771 [Oculina patagonica]
MKDQKCLTCLEEAPTFNVLDSFVLLYPCWEKFTRRQYHEQRETRSTASPHRGMSLPARTIARITRNNPSQLTTCHPVNVPSMRQRTQKQPNVTAEDRKRDPYIIRRTDVLQFLSNMHT